jgi:hypothetical protein
MAGSVFSEIAVGEMIRDEGLAPCPQIASKHVVSANEHKQHDAVWIWPNRNLLQLRQRLRGLIRFDQFIQR